MNEHREALRELHLFAGIGGGILGGMLLGHQCVCAVEWNDYCQEVLRARQADGCLEQFPIFGDIREFDGTAWRGRVDVVCGGFPCQPWSSAGKRRGAADPRHLWPEMARVVAECRPRFVFAENVSVAAFEEPLRDLRAMGYRVPPALCLAADDVGAPYERSRWWVLASDVDCDRESVVAVDAEVAEAQGTRSKARGRRGGQWAPSRSRLLRLVSRLPARVDPEKRITAAGNAQVPQVAAAAFAILMQRMEHREAGQRTARAAAETRQRPSYSLFPTPARLAL